MSGDFPDIRPDYGLGLLTGHLACVSEPGDLTREIAITWSSVRVTDATTSHNMKTVTVRPY